jgi:hypothetical protein
MGVLPKMFDAEFYEFAEDESPWNLARAKNRFNCENRCGDRTTKRGEAEDKRGNKQPQSPSVVEPQPNER